MPLTIRTAARLLSDHGLLNEIIADDVWTLDASHIVDADTPIAAITYDTRQLSSNALLVCKGRFHPEFLDGLDQHDLIGYVAEDDYSSHISAPGLIVTDARKALSLLSAEFYGRPQDELTVIGITGTKGKTTTAYLTHAILNAYSDGHAALFSSVDNCLDGYTREESELTTPESLDAFRMMRQAVSNGMRYLVMEVSSQAYKVNRVHGLTFDIGAFLNISPDHISDIEHPTFEDYFHCKRQIIPNSRTLILNASCAHADLIRQDASRAGVPITEFMLRRDADDTHTDDAHGHTGPGSIVSTVTALDDDTFTLMTGDITDTFHLQLPGAFNMDNATAAIAIALSAGVPVDSPALHAIETVRVPGRMNTVTDPSTQTTAIVDYAHNYASVTALLDYVDHRYGATHPAITLVTGAAGDKAIDRRAEIVEAAQHRISRFIFTAEDTNTEPYLDICSHMRSHVTVDVDADIIVDRTKAITSAILEAQRHPERADIILIIGKGHERWIKNQNRHIPYEGDDVVATRLMHVPVE